MANIGDTNFSLKPDVNMAAIASLYQKKATDEQTMRAQQSNIESQQQERVMNIMKMASDMTQGIIQHSAQSQMMAGRKNLMDLMGSANLPSDVTTSDQTPIPRSQTPEFQAQYKKAAFQANPEAASKDIAERAFAPKIPTLQSKSVTVNGNPTVLNYNPTTGSYHDMQGNAVSGDIKPYSSMAEEPTITDADRQKYGPLVQRLVDGKATAGDFATARGTLKTKLAMLATEKDSSYDPTNVPQRVAIRKEFTSGSSAKNLTSLNTVIGHLDTLQAAADDLDNKKLKKYNSVDNYLKKETGKPEVVKFNAARNAVSNELGRVFTGVGQVTEAEKQAFREDLNAANSPDQIKAVTETYIDLIKSRTDAIKSNWTQVMGGSNPPTPILNDKSKKLLQKHGYDPVTMEKTGTLEDKKAALRAKLGL